MYLVLALAAAVAYGTADFLGGLASRRSAVVAVILLSQSVGFVGVVVVAPLLSAPPGFAAFGWGASAGFAYGIGILLLYRGLAMGRMSVVAPITAVCALSLPVAFGFLIGEDPGNWAAVGILLAVMAIVLVSNEPSPATGDAHTTTARAFRRRRMLVLTAIGAGLAMGVFFVCLARTTSDAGLWPLIASRGISVGCFSAIALITRQSLRLPRAALYLALAAGVLDISGNTLYLVSARAGMVSLAATLTSLYPASTVLLASLVLRERIRMPQAIGLACAALAVMLMTATQ